MGSLLLVVMAALAFAAQPDGGLVPPEQLNVRVVKEHAKVGEPITLDIVVTHQSDQRYELKTPGDLGDFDYLGQERRRVDGPTSSTTTIQVKLSAFQLGSLDTPQLELEVTAPQGTSTVSLPRSKVEIDSSLPPDAQSKGEELYDVKPPEEVLIRTWRLLYILAALAGLIGLGYAIYRYRSRPQTAVPAFVPPPEPLHVRATRALDALAADNLPARGEFKPFYFRLSEIVRSYLGERYGFDALESTTPELLQALHTRSTPGLPLPDLATFAQSSDFVRYAKQSPSVEECKQHLELAYRIVQLTQTAAVPTRPA